MTREAKDAKSENLLNVEHCKRQKAVDFARASVDLEGGHSFRNRKSPRPALHR